MWFCANLDETKADMVQFTKGMELEMDCQTSRNFYRKSKLNMQLQTQVYITYTSCV